MLVLTRMINEKIFIGDNVVVTVVDIYGNKVRLGIEAPRATAVDREEIREAKLNEARHREALPAPVPLAPLAVGARIVPPVVVRRGPVPGGPLVNRPPRTFFPVDPGGPSDG
jgi:carbon storage regulator